VAKSLDESIKNDDSGRIGAAFLIRMDLAIELQELLFQGCEQGSV